ASAEETAAALHADGADGAHQRDVRRAAAAHAAAGDRAKHLGHFRVVGPVRRAAETYLELARAGAALHVVARLVEVSDLVDQTARLRLGGRERSIFGGLADGLTARVGEPGEPLVADGAEHAFERSLGLRARTLAGERLFGALEFADLQEVDADAELV